MTKSEKADGVKTMALGTAYLLRGYQEVRGVDRGLKGMRARIPEA